MSCVDNLLKTKVPFIFSLTLMIVPGCMYFTRVFQCDNLTNIYLVFHFGMHIFFYKLHELAVEFSF